MLKNYDNSISFKSITPMFFLGYLMALTSSFFKHIMIEVPSILTIYVNIIALFFILIFLLVKGIRTSYFFETIVLALISFLSFITIKNIEVIVYIAIIVASQHIEFDKILSFFLKVIGFYILLTVFLSYFELIPNLVFYQRDTLRYSFGTIYPTVLASYFFFLVITYVLLRDYKITYFEIITIFILNVFVLRITDSRGVFFSLLLLIIIIVMQDSGFLNLNAYLIKHIFIICVVGIPLLVVFLSYNFKNNDYLFNYLDNILSNRLTLSNSAFYKYNVNFFGQQVLMNGFGRSKAFGTEYFYLDSLAIEMLFSKGFILLTFYIYSMYKILVKFYKKNRWIMVFCLLIITLYDVTDNKSFRISFNPILLALFSNIHEYGGENE